MLQSFARETLGSFGQNHIVRLDDDLERRRVEPVVGTLCQARGAGDAAVQDAAGRGLTVTPRWLASSERTFAAKRHHVDRLGDVAVATGRAHPGFIALHRVGREGHDDDVLGYRVGLQATRELDAVHHRHLDVHQDQLGREDRDLQQRMAGVGSPLDQVAGGTQDELPHLEEHFGLSMGAAQRAVCALGNIGGAGGGKAPRPNALSLRRTLRLGDHRRQACGQPRGVGNAHLLRFLGFLVAVLAFVHAVYSLVIDDKYVARCRVPASVRCRTQTAERDEARTGRVCASKRKGMGPGLRPSGCSHQSAACRSTSDTARSQ